MDFSPPTRLLLPAVAGHSRLSGPTARPRVTHQTRHRIHLCSTLLLLAAAAAGCRSLPDAAPPALAPVNAEDEVALHRAQHAVQNAFPTEYRAIHRAVLTVGRKQFACDGLMTASADHSRQLAIVNTLGLVTEVRVNADGTGDVLTVTPLFRERWSRDFVLRDVRRLFVPPTDLQPAGRREDQAIVLESPADVPGMTCEYVCSPDGRRWTELGVYLDGRRIYEAVLSDHREGAGQQMLTPHEVHVMTAAYDLHLRVAQLRARDRAQPPEAAR